MFRSLGPNRTSRGVGAGGASPREWVSHRYLPLAWLSLATTALIHVVLGGPVEFRVDVYFLLINLGGELLRRLRSRHVVLLHMFALFPLILWYSGAPEGIPDQLGAQVVIFAAILMLPNIILVSLYGMRAAIASTALGVLGVLTLAPTPAELATGVFLVAVAGLIGGVFFHRLIVALEETQQALAQAAYLDPLTGLRNRRAFAADYARLGGEVLTVWDLDGLKEVNDRHGHAAGDEFLLQFVDAFRAACGPACRLYRLGGDEFAGVHPRLDPGVVAAAVRDRFPHVSFGSVEIAGRSLHEAMAEADALLYREKYARAAPFAPRLVVDLNTSRRAPIAVQDVLPAASGPVDA